MLFERNVELILGRHVLALEILCGGGSEDTLATVTTSLQKEASGDNGRNNDDQDRVEHHVACVRSKREAQE